MSATFGMNKFSVQRTGVQVEVPNNNLARIMYYLSCVFNTIQYNESNKLSDYQHYYYLNEDEKKAVYALAVLLNPKLFLDANIFILDDGTLTGNFGNEFFKITDERIGVHVNQELMIGGRSVKVLSIMACKRSWLDNNYFSRLGGLYNEINRSRLVYNEYNATSSRIIVNQTTPVVYHVQPARPRKEFDICQCLLCTLFWIYCFPIALIYYIFCVQTDN